MVYNGDLVFVCMIGALSLQGWNLRGKKQIFRTDMSFNLRNIIRPEIKRILIRPKDGFHLGLALRIAMLK